MSTEQVWSRREVLRTGVGAAAVAAVGGMGGVGVGVPFVRGADKSGLGPVVVGSGEHTYECVHDWAKCPSNIAFGNTHGVVFDKDGLCYIKHTVHASSQSGDALCVFDADGKFVRSWGAEFRGGAHGLSMAREKAGEFLWLSDCNRGVVQKQTLKGEVVLDLAWPEASGVYNNKGEYKPTNVAIVPETVGGEWAAYAGDVFVGDGYGKSWIHRYSAKGEYKGTFGGPGRERGQVSCPHGIAIDMRSGKPEVLVADRANRRLQRFGLDGRHLGFVSKDLKLPCHFDFRGDVALVPDLDSRVTLLDKNNALLVHLGDGEKDGGQGLRGEAREKFIPGKFICPHSAAFDAKGNIFVVEWVEVGRVTKLVKK